MKSFLHRLARASGRAGLPFLLAAVLGVVPARQTVAEPPWTLEGQPFMQNFTPHDYHGSVQCWGIVQDARGLVYIGNQAAVLEYDGSAWRKIPVGSDGWITGVAYEAATDRVFVGGVNELGYLKLVPGGERTYISLLGELPADARVTGSIRSIFAAPTGVFFVGEHQVMRWRDGRFQVWRLTQGSVLHGGWAAGSLYVQSAETGLLRLENDAFAPASGDPLLRTAAVRSVVDGADGATLVGTAHDGLFRLRDGALRPFGSAFDGWLKDKGIYKLLPLRDGSLAVATDAAGLLVLDREGRFRNHVDDAGGLHGNNILSLCEDVEGGLWIGLQAGVTRAEIDSPLSIFRAGPEDDLSNTFCGDYCGGTMVLGTFSGLYRLAADPAAATAAHLEHIPGITENFTSATAVEGGLLLGAAGKVALLDPDFRQTVVLATESQKQSIWVSRQSPGRGYVCEENGRLSALRLDPATRHWVVAGVVAELGGPDLDAGLVESAQGDLWLGSSERGLFRVRPASTPGQAPAVTSFLDAPGPLRGERYAYVTADGGPILVVTPSKLYYLDERGQNVRPATEFGPGLVDGSLHYEGAMSYDARSIWFTANRLHDPAAEHLFGQAVAAEAGRPPAFRNLPRKIEEVIGRVQGFLPMNNAPEKLETLLILGSTGNGVVRLDVPRWEAALARPFATLVRRAVATEQGRPAGEPPPVLGDALPYARNSLHFEYAAGTLAFGAAPRFQTRLAGFGAGDWSDFSERNGVDYLNLPEGSYTFEVRARDADGQLGSVASLPFRVLPPWQRSGWAYTAYILSSAAGIYTLVRWQLGRLRAQNTRLEQVIEARTGELRHAKDAAEAANRAKSAFLANMTHELRTPLNAILGYSQILLKDADLSARNRERVRTVDRSGHHLLSMINEVLDLSKIEAGKLALLPIDFALDALLDDLGAAFAPRLAEKGLGFVRTRAPGLPAVVHTDAGKLRQVLFNLLGNALKFTRAGEVRLEVTPTPTPTHDPQGARVRFSVADTGVGIAAAELRHIFLAFHQAGDPQAAAATQGTGLGLSISQRLVELLGGHLQVESTPGAGSRFWFELALAPGAAGAAGAAGASSGAAVAAAGGPVVGYAGAVRRLLVVDDEAVNRQVLAELLAPLGFAIEQAAGGAAALQRCADARAPRLDAVLLDLRMSPVGGLEVARTLRAQGSTVRIVAVSASVFADDRQQAIAAGCDDFLPKPFKEEQLLAVLGRILDLQWVFADVVADPAATGTATADPAQFAREIDALLELAHHGDILGLQARFAAVREAGGIPAQARELARRLEPLLAGYEVDRVHDLLTEFKQHGGD